MYIVSLVFKTCKRKTTRVRWQHDMIFHCLEGQAFTYVPFLALIVHFEKKNIPSKINRQGIYSRKLRQCSNDQSFTSQAIQKNKLQQRGKNSIGTSFPSDCSPVPSPISITSPPMSSTKISKTATIVISGSTFELKNIGPLTTTYSAPAACFTEQYTTTRGVGTWLALGVESRWDCYPPGFSTVDTAWAAYYSPGVCPASYTPAATLPWRWLAPSESGYNCCPMYGVPPPPTT